jgi:PKD repeat protein
VVNGVTATFASSNPTDGSLDVVFNAEESRGSDSGFGGRNTISNYIWHFGIPGTATLVETTSPIINQTFPFAGIYTVTLTVEDSDGRRQTSNQSITVVN